MHNIDTQIMSSWLNTLGHTVFDTPGVGVKSITVEYWDGEQTDQLSLDVEDVRNTMHVSLMNAVLIRIDRDKVDKVSEHA